MAEGFQLPDPSDQEPLCPVNGLAGLDRLQLLLVAGVTRPPYFLVAGTGGIVEVKEVV